MASLKIASSGRLRFDAFDTAKTEVRVPLTDGNLFGGHISATRDRAGLISATIRLGLIVISASGRDGKNAKDGPLKYRSSDQEIGQFSTLCPLDHASRLLAEFLVEQGITATILALEIGKTLEIKADDTMPTGRWTIAPEIMGETENGIAKYLLMRKGDEFIFGWDGSKMPGHVNIWRAHDGTDNLGGGFMSLYESFGLRLTDKSSTYGQPPFELVYDAALAVVQAAKPGIAITEMLVEGTERFELAKH